MRFPLFMALAAAVPFGLSGPLAGGEGGTEAWIRVSLVALSAILVLAAFRVRSGLIGPGLAAALALAACPSVPDAIASPHATRSLGVLAGLSLLLLLAARTPWAGKVSFGLAPVALAVAILGTSGADAHGAAAYDPPVAAALALAVAAGETALLLARREGPARRALLAGLALSILASAVLGQLRARSWGDPAAFADRAVAEEPRSPAALGILAGARTGAADRAGAAAALRSFAETVEAGEGRRCGPGARRSGSDGVAAAARFILEGATAADREAAEAALRAAVRFAPESSRAAVALAEALLARGEFQEPIRILEAAVAADRTDADALGALARALLAAGRVPESVEAARTATGLRPTEKRFAVTWAEGLLATGRGGEALEILHLALGGAPPWDPLVARAYSAAQLRLAREDVSTGNPGRARRKLLSAAQYDRSDPACAALLADLDRRMEAERPEMEKLLERDAAGKVNPDDWLLYTVWLCRWGEFEVAEPHFRRMVKLLGTTPAVHFQIGLEFWEGRGSVEGVEKAVASYQQAVALDPGYAEAWNRLWQCHRLLGRAEDARSAARRFLELAPAHPDAAAAQMLLEGK